MKKTVQYAVTITIGVTAPQDCEGLLQKGFEHLCAKILLGGLPVAVEMKQAEIQVVGEKERVSTVKLEGA